MRATINSGTDEEISWVVDEYITPDLVEQIKLVGIDKGIDWTNSPLYTLMEILLDGGDREKLEERLYDEDEELVELIMAELDVMNIVSSVKNLHRKQLARLYLPVMLVMLDLF